PPPPSRGATLALHAALPIWERALSMMRGHDGHELLLHPIADGVPHHPLLLREQGLDAVIVDAAKAFHRAVPSTRGWSGGRVAPRDRKSTRLNSSHGSSSYAV